MPDPNKLAALREAKFRVLPTCVSCRYWHGKRDSHGARWGACPLIHYQHGKHTGDERTASTPDIGWCLKYEADAEYLVGRLAAHMEFFDEEGVSCSKIVLVCSLCCRRAEVEATEDYPADGNPRRGKAQVTAHSALPRGWSVRERDGDLLHHSHGDHTPQSRFFCAPKCRSAWEEAESAGVDAFREVVRRAGLEMQGAVDALGQVAFETPAPPPVYEPPPEPEDLPF